GYTPVFDRGPRGGAQDRPSSGAHPIARRAPSLEAADMDCVPSLAVLSVVIAIACPAPIGLAQQDPTPPGGRPDLSFEELRDRFASPDMRYAPFAFWFWDAPLDAGQTARMAAEMASQGLNPGYAHPRHGLPHDQWLTEPWFQAFEA